MATLMDDFLSDCSLEMKGSSEDGSLQVEFTGLKYHEASFLMVFRSSAIFTVFDGDGAPYTNKKDIEMLLGYIDEEMLFEVDSLELVFKSLQEIGFGIEYVPIYELILDSILEPGFKSIKWRDAESSMRA